MTRLRTAPSRREWRRQSWSTARFAWATGDAKVRCVPAHDPRWSHLGDVTDMPQHTLEEIRHFMEIYKDLEPEKQAVVGGWEGRDVAWRVIEEARGRLGQAGRGSLPGRHVRQDPRHDVLMARTSQVLPEGRSSAPDRTSGFCRYFGTSMPTASASGVACR